MSDQPCPGSCNARWRHDPDTTTPVPGMPVLCYDCTTHLEQQLNTIPALGARLTPGSLNTPREATESRPQATAHPSPSPAWDLIDQATRYVHDAATQVCVWAHQPPPRPIAHLTRDTATLIRHLTVALSHPAPPDEHAQWATIHRAHPWWWRTDATEYLYAGLTRVHTSLVTGTGTRRLVIRLPEPCPRCEHRGVLTRTDGDDLVRCRRCTAVWDHDHLPMLTRASLDAARQLTQEATQ